MGRLIGAVLVVLWLPGPLFAQEADVPGSQDHAGISRFPGSYIIGYDFREYDELTLALGPLMGRAPSKLRTVEGKVTRILYVAPAGRSSLEVAHSYWAALKQAGFGGLFGCDRDDCGYTDSFIDWLLPPERRLKNRGQLSEYAIAASFSRDLRYLVAKLDHAQGTVYVSLCVAIFGKEFILDQIFDRAVALLEIVDTTAMEGGMIEVDAAAMARGLAETGRVALYGIHFDFDTDVIRPESERTLTEIAKLMSQQPDLKLNVVGHTDNVGAPDYNRGLSERRASAVVRQLVSQYGIDNQRLAPVGMGALAPAVSNETEDGRAKNRRVELVKR